jgi:hypothetical protein
MIRLIAGNPRRVRLTCKISISYGWHNQRASAPPPRPVPGELAVQPAGRRSVTGDMTGTLALAKPPVTTMPTPPQWHVMQ